MSGKSTKLLEWLILDRGTRDIVVVIIKLQTNFPKKIPRKDDFILGYLTIRATLSSLLRRLMCKQGKISPESLTNS